MDRALLSIRGRWGNGSVLLNHGGTKCKFPHIVYVDDAVQQAESVEGLDIMVGCFDAKSKSNQT